MHESREQATNRTSRRDFMRSAGSVALAAPLASSFLLRSASAASQFASRASDYKALVCIFLYGGNDANNLLVPIDSRYSTYASARGHLALPKQSLLSLESASGKNEFGLHPSCTRLAQMFNSGKLAVLANVGTLHQSGTLFDHADQQAQWQCADEQGRGWGGRIAERIAINAPKSNSTVAVSLGGDNRFQKGATLQPTHAAPTNRRLASAEWNSLFQNDALGNQLRTIAELIQSRSHTDHNRQIFFASLGGFDLHSSQVDASDPTRGAHANLLNELSEAMYSFHIAMDRIGLADQVTQFTASEFGRSMQSNGEGSDHGWGSHHLIAGGAVQGGNVFGTFPNPESIENGILIPTASVDQYSATLARWFGADESDLRSTFPNLKNFQRSDLGFMRSMNPVV